MKGLVLHDTKDIRYEEVDDPTNVGAGDALIKITSCSICGSDLHVYRGNDPAELLGDQPFRGVIGHEAIGEVVEAGAGVRNFKPGDKVMLSAAVGCGECRPCQARDPLRCEGIGFRSYGGAGSFALGGCQSEAVITPAADFNLASIPDGISQNAALMLTDNLPTAFMGCVKAEITPGQSVGIIGLGAIGLMAVECALVMGAERVFAIDRNASRRKMASELGAIVCAPDDAIEHIAAETKGKMLHGVVDAAGGTPAVMLAIKLAGIGGVVSSVGVNLQQISFPMIDMFLKGITFRSGICPVGLYWPALIPLVQSGRLRPDRFVTHTLPLGDGPEAYTKLDLKRDEALKIILVP